ncbi:hypothetical protein ILUMI_12899 [Ignelater luminosus]|uniref:Peptidase S1 domain-containing protein n=1 Tax=Ignelater luminosus TaxID=2038154 RepID=A0A8K0CX92_IGNLU|nr:hypothetical protein ILUMI_12899 [Ignelater luminosus]
MKQLYLLFILELALCTYTQTLYQPAAGKVKLMKTKKLTLHLYNHKNHLLQKENIARKSVRHHYTPALPPVKTRRTFGGHLVDIKQKPFVAFLLTQFFGPWHLIGGAAIVGSYWAITAAHCIKDITDANIKKGLVSVCGNTSNWKRGCNKHEIIQKYIHEKYNKNNGVDYDIALVKVKQPFDGKYEKPIKLARSNNKYPRIVHAAVFGWGFRDQVERNVSNILGYITVNLMNHNTCKKKYPNRNYTVTSRMICAIDKEKDACFIDSGGPVVQNNVLIGIVSRQPYGCADYSPTVYTKVPEFNGWLQKKMEK